MAVAEQDRQTNIRKRKGHRRQEKSYADHQAVVIRQIQAQKNERKKEERDAIKKEKDADPFFRPINGKIPGFRIYNEAARDQAEEGDGDRHKSRIREKGHGKYPHERELIH